MGNDMIRPQRAPFSGTTVDPAKTKGDIDKLLKEFGCEGAQWNEDYTSNHIELRFLVEIDWQGEKRKVGVKLTPPMFMQKRKSWNRSKSRYEMIEAPNVSQSLRLMWWYLKAKLTAVAYGVTPFEEEFLGDIVVNSEQGERRLIDIIRENPTVLSLPHKLNLNSGTPNLV